MLPRLSYGQLVLSLNMAASLWLPPDLLYR